jgi:hypothetical protein
VFLRDGVSPVDVTGLVGQPAAFVCSVSESTYGASLNFESFVTDTDLEQIAQALPAVAAR